MRPQPAIRTANKEPNDLKASSHALLNPASFHRQRRSALSCCNAVQGILRPRDAFAPPQASSTRPRGAGIGRPNSRAVSIHS